MEPRTRLSLGGRATPLLSKQTCPLRRPTHAEPGPISGALHNVAEQGAEKALESPRVESAWESANRTADQVLVTIVKGGGSRVQINAGPSRWTCAKLSFSWEVSSVEGVPVLQTVFLAPGRGEKRL